MICCPDRSRDLDRWSGASDVIAGGVVRAPTEDLRARRRPSDVTYQQQQQQQQRQRSGRGSAASAGRRMESTSSSSVSSSAGGVVGRRPKRQRYEYNEAQRRLLADVYARRKSLRWSCCKTIHVGGFKAGLRTCPHNKFQERPSSRMQGTF